MKHLHFALVSIMILLSVSLHAQLNYTFSAAAATYLPITGGTTPVLINRPYGVGQYSYTYDEGFANDVPIGFTFNYNGHDYTTININANGFATFTPFIETTNLIESFYNNNLSGGPAPDNNTPVIAPLWDDLTLQVNSNFRYLTTGTAGNRIFTVEWAKAKWQYDATAAVLSFELKLYEGTNVIEFCYKDEGGSTSHNAYASIGISDRKAYQNTFMSLQNTSASPTVSSTVENQNLNVKPANNQVYRFTPYPCNITTSLRFVTLTPNTADLGWTSVNGVSNYEYTVTTSPIEPASGTNVASTQVSVGSLNADTKYYWYVRSACSASAKSIWLKDSFTTANDPVSLPYSEGFEIIPLNGQLPENMRNQDFKDTSRWYSQENEGWFWDFTPNTGTYSGAYYPFFFDADAWLFTPGFNLTAWKTYNLKFYYSALAFSVINSASMEVKYGNKIGATAMTSGTLVTLNNFSNSTYKDTTISFTPSVSGVYYFGFHDYSSKGDAAAEIDDISITAATLPVTLINFSGEIKGKQNILHWATATEESNMGFEIQRSIDGIDFSKIGFVNTKAADGNSNAKINYNFTDAAYTSNTNYYRLKQIDKDGKFNYSNIIVLRDENAPSLSKIIIYPNPAKNMLNVKIASNGTNQIALLVTDLKGKLLLNKITNVGNGESIIQVDVSHLAAGTYFLKLLSENGKENQIRKFVKQ